MTSTNVIAQVAAKKGNTMKRLAITLMTAACAVAHLPRAM